MIRHITENFNVAVANGATDSDPIRVDNAIGLSVKLPAAFTLTVATMKILGSQDGGTYTPLQDAAGADVTYSALAVSDLIDISDHIRGLYAIKLQFGTAQAAARQLTALRKS